MCLTASNSIHPTSAPTGTDDDMGGNDKADALAWIELAKRISRKDKAATSSQNSGPAFRY
jgi:hypothetical protein